MGEKTEADYHQKKEKGDQGFCEYSTRYEEKLTGKKTEDRV
jgi:hypothetical protein